MDWAVDEINKKNCTKTGQSNRENQTRSQTLKRNNETRPKEKILSSDLPPFCSCGHMIDI